LVLVGLHAVQANRLNPSKWKENLLFIAKVSFQLSLQYEIVAV